jgi:hypothetical protein
MANKKANNTIAPVTDTEAEYLKAVEEGKAATADISGRQWVLGDLADKVGKAYGENRLSQFATDINYPNAICTLGRCRDVCRAFPKNRVRPRFFSCAQLLATHPDRFEIVERNPDISKAEAREIMSLWRAENPSTAEAEQPEDEDPLDEDDEAGPIPTTTSTKAAKTKGPKKTADNEWSGDSKRWQSDVVIVATQAIDLAEVRKRCSPQQRRDLLAILEPPLIETVRKASEAFGELAAWLRKLSNEAANTAIQEGHVRTSPKRAPHAE